MPTFCRHNRFLERCPICSKTLPGAAPTAGRRPARAARAGKAAAGGEGGRRRARDAGLRVQREDRAADDGYRSALVPGVRASADADRLAQEIAFASARLRALEVDPPGLYGEARALAAPDLERATWMCFLTAYLSPLDDGDDPFAGIRDVLVAAPTLAAADESLDLSEIPLGPRSSHEPARGAETLGAYRQWVARVGGEGGTQVLAFAGDPAWSAERRFERLFERLALPGFGRVGRYELLVTLGRLGLYELRPDSLHLAGAGGVSGADATTLAAKRVFGIGDPLLLDRRAAALAQAAGVPIEALDLALVNWAAPRRASVGVSPELEDADAFARAGEALGL
jgi:alpha-glutamyl/putrescinyl thymine pyrophosphorylase-like protein